MAGTLILICGLPGAGKTTLAKKLEQERSLIRLCPDEWIEEILADPLDTAERDRLRDPVENLQWELAQTWLLKGLSIVLENGFWAEEERTLYAIRALELGATIELHYLAISPTEQWRRIEERNRLLTRKTFIMKKEELEESRRTFQAPSQEELSFYDDYSVTEA